MKFHSKTIVGLLLIMMTLWGAPLYGAKSSQSEQPSQDQPKTSQQGTSSKSQSQNKPKKSEGQNEPKAVVKTESEVQEPSPLQAMEQVAEQIVVLAANEQWTQVQKQVNEVRLDWLEFQPVDPSNAEPASMQRMEYALRQLALVGGQHKRLATVLAANEVGSMVMEVYDLYHPTLPGSVERLDEHQRRIILDTALGQFQDASRELQGANRIWYYFKPSLIYNGGGDLADDFQATLDIEREYIDAKKRTELLAAANHAITSLFQVADLFA